MSFDRILVTGAAGRIAGAIRPALREGRAELRLTDAEPVADLAPNETFVRADLADADAIAAAAEGVDAIVHLGAVADEAAFDVLAAPNLHGSFHVYDAARRAGARRVVYASTNRVTGFYPVEQRLTGREPVRPDGIYAATKVWGEALGRMFHDKFGLEVVCVRIGSFEERPTQARFLATWLSPGDAARLFSACLTEEVPVGCEVLYGVSANARSWWDPAPAARLGYVPRDDAEAFAGDVTGAAPVLQGGDSTAPESGGWAS